MTALLGPDAWTSEKEAARIQANTEPGLGDVLTVRSDPIPGWTVQVHFGPTPDRIRLMYSTLAVLEQEVNWPRDELVALAWQIVDALHTGMGVPLGDGGDLLPLPERRRLDRRWVIAMVVIVLLGLFAVALTL